VLSFHAVFQHNVAHSHQCGCLVARTSNNVHRESNIGNNDETCGAVLSKRQRKMDAEDRFDKLTSFSFVQKHSCFEGDTSKLETLLFVVFPMAFFSSS